MVHSTRLRISLCAASSARACALRAISSACRPLGGESCTVGAWLGFGFGLGLGLGLSFGFGFGLAVRLGSGFG